MRKPQTVRDVAQMVFGINPDGPVDLDALLTQLAGDVSDDQDISDDHPRFYAHCTVMALYGDRDQATQDRIDAIRYDQISEANAIEREAIAWIRHTWLR
jgi:hypothetical protein